MKNEKKIQLSLLILVLGTTMFYGCKKDKPEEIIPNLYNGKSTAVFNNNLTYGNVTDQDGNMYKTIKIGTQTWMAENLRTTIYRNGEPISLVTNDTIWFYLSTPAYCNFENTLKDTSIATNGRLYNWYSVNDNRKISPEGWHIPNRSDWQILIDFLGNDTIIGGKMKEAGFRHWTSPNMEADNSCGFTALPSGERFYHFDSFGESSSFWSSKQYESDSTYAYFYGNHFDDANIFIACSPKLCGFSIRCVKD